MKKSNMLIAVFAVLAAASVAKAGEIEIDFDGTKGLKPQSMHDIFAGSHQIVPQEALAKVTLPVPVDPDESPVPMIEPWNIDPMGYCMMVPWVDENGVLHDCGVQPNPSVGYCEQIEIAPGVDFPLCFSGVAVAELNSNPGVMLEIGAGLKRAYPGYSAQPGFAAAVQELSKDKSTRILYNGKKLFFARRAYSNKMDGWDHTDIYTPITDAVDSLPNNGTNTSIGAASGAIAGASGGVVGTVLGAIGGAIAGLAADLAS
ncbi:MAG: hypothetical protein A2049_01850 [Elusimicrobia bacterium GWA2_62_23]|nr:MAG: hypothetical protein A2049_01850 [Elusimicrobia bacterium GWA2_62_23]HBB66621.1 hypothetical protein [Elusimicrobiota bacterium]